jgi:F0F1-type ATP synthase assembly protein I
LATLASRQITNLVIVAALLASLGFPDVTTSAAGALVSAELAAAAAMMLAKVRAKSTAKRRAATLANNHRSLEIAPKTLTSSHNP